MEISREVFDQQRQPRFGNSNPERMQLAFWEWMIRGDGIPSHPGKGGLEDIDLAMRDAKLKSAYGPYHARDIFQIPSNCADGPIWTFDRMGTTRSELPDGRVICIGGEHEDFYDPDFYIYNDVIVLGPISQVEIYGYPKAVFPPTDFHTATVASDRIIIIGGLGYRDERRPNDTPVYSLDLSQYQITQLMASGDMPGWLSKHEACYGPEGIITVRGGQVIHEHCGQQRLRRNFEDYVLDLRSGVWQRLTNRNWRQFSIRQEDGLFVLKQRPEPGTLLPLNIEHTVVPCEGEEDARVILAGVPVSLRIGVKYIEVVIEGDIPEAVAARFAQEICANTEAAIQRKCILEPM